MTVVNFTGQRKTATPLDRKAVADWMREVADHIESGDIISVAYVALYAEAGMAKWDWYTLPPSDRFAVMGAIQALLANYTADTIENCPTFELDA